MIFASVIRSLLFLMEGTRTVGTATPPNERPEAAKSFACPKRAQTYEWG
jgi:hypothetical protein